MEQEKDSLGMLDLMIHPGFCVNNGVITKVNKAAEGLLLTAGTNIQPLLLTGKEEYAAFTDGCLYLSLSVSGKPWGASVSRVGNAHVFVLEQESDFGELRSMALAARELREPLTNIMVTANRLFPLTSDDPETKGQVARLNRGLYQMLRILGNMSDAGRSTSLSRMESRDVNSLFAEIFERAETLVAHAGITLTYRGLDQAAVCPVDAEQLERAIWNMISNAIKFTPVGGTIQVSLTRNGSMLYLQVRDNGSGIAENIKGSVFSRYLRYPAIEDNRYGIGLGMVLIRSAAANHGGTVLIDSPKGSGTRVTMTINMNCDQGQDTTLRSPILRVDYAGGRDHSLLELSDHLPPSLYEI